MSAQSFNVGGGWGSTYNWNASIDDESALDADGKKTVNGILQYQWDVSGQYAQGAGTDDHLIVFVPGTTVNNGIWFYRTTDVDATALAAVPHNFSRYSNQTVDWNISGVSTNFSTASAFVNGVIPTSAPAGSGPTVTSLTYTSGTSGTILTSDTVSVSDWGATKNDSSFTLSSSNFSLTGPTTIPPSDGTGYYWTLTPNGTAVYKVNIDGKVLDFTYYDTSWLSSASSSRTTNSTRVLNVLSSIPSTSDMYKKNYNGSFWLNAFNLNQLTKITHPQHIYYKISTATSTSGVSLREHYGFRIRQAGSDIKGYFYVYKYRTDTPYNDMYIESSYFTIGAQEEMSWTVTDSMDTFLLSGNQYKLSLHDWVYTNHPEGDNYTPPVRRGKVSHNFW